MAVDKSRNCLTFLPQGYYIAFSGRCGISDNDSCYFMEIKLSKKLILGMALSLLLAGGSFFSAQAGCDLGLNGSSAHSTCSLFGSQAPRDADMDATAKQECPAASQGPYGYETNKKDGISSYPDKP